MFVRYAKDAGHLLKADQDLALTLVAGAGLARDT